MDRNLLSQPTTLMPEALASAVPERKTRVARRLCARCADIDLQKTFINHRYEDIELGSQSTWRPDECDLCDFLSRIFPKVPQSRSGTLPVLSSCLPSTEATEQVRLSAPKLRPAILQRMQHRINTFHIGVPQLAFEQHCRRYFALGTHPGRDLKESVVLVWSNRDLSSQMDITPPMINFNLIKGWLQKIPVQTHGNPEQEVVHYASLHGLEAFNGLSLHVIDCESRSLVRLPTHTQAQYVTLSYVWGSPSEPRIKDDILSDPTPTIKDSITVCQKLGYKYLWVDRYCIPQNDVQERHRQVQQMGAIYRNSALTIVACAGSDPQYGLPGVSQSRIQYPSIMIMHVGYMQVIPVTDDIKHSAWARRGWTYQEALLSQARLYFTDRQVYYEDEESLNCEVNTLAGVKIPDDFDWGDSWIYSRTAWSNSPMDIYNCIRESSTRVLSFPSDAIDVLQGIFATFEEKFQIRHVCGMAFMQSEKSVEPSLRQIQLLKGEIPTMQYSLLFRTNFESIRCGAFPSWSWAGWTGRKDWQPWEKLRKNSRIAIDRNLAFVVAVELAPNLIISWAEFETCYDALRVQSVQSIKIIHIEAYLMPILGYVERERYGVSEGIFKLQDEISFTVLGADEHMTSIKDKKGCAILRLFSPELTYFDIPHMLVRKKGTYWERVIQLDGYYKDQYGSRLYSDRWPGVLQTIRLG